MNVTVRLTVRTDRPYTKTPHFVSSLTGEPLGEYYCTTGVEADLRDATRSAVRHMIEYLCATYKMNRVEAYMLCSVAGDLRLHEVVRLSQLILAKLES
jgi:acetamidase/formamidase